MKKYFLYIVVVILFSCRREAINTSLHNANTPEYIAKSEFGKTLANAIQKEPALREFLKMESLKKFNNENDILFAAVRDLKIDGQSSFYDLLLKNTESVSKLNDAINALPLLTIFIPTLPEFSPETWNAQSEIPEVAIEPDKSSHDNKIDFYTSSSKHSEPHYLIPGFPVVVIKNNERVVVKGSQLDISKQFVNANEEFIPYKTVNGITYLFAGKAFVGNSSLLRNSLNSRLGTNNPSNNIYTIDKVNVDAFNSGAEWHRDFVYYGIDPSNGVFNGAYRNNYHEFVKSIKFISPNDVETVSDDQFDPKPAGLVTSFTETPPQLWTEGNYEFYVDIIVNSKNGTGSILRKSFTAKGSDLFFINYYKYKQMYSTRYFKIQSYSSKEYNPNLDLVPWDLDNYGNAWKFIVMEYDPATTTTKTVTHTSTFGSNFEFNVPLGEKVKIGAKFGLSATNQTTTTTSYTYSTGSDDLGEGILAFDYSIITALTGTATSQQYATYETSTGRISFSVEPVKVW